MKRVFLLVLLTGMACAPALAAMPVNWPDLKGPASTSFEDPFEALSIRQLQSLGMVLRLREALDSGTSGASDADLRARLQREEAMLAAEGVNVDWLLSHREEIARKRAVASLSGNSSLTGKAITITGYAIPVEGPGGAGEANGYLVPEQGMCSHMPAPPPNQMIRYVVKSGNQADYVYEPVVLTGRLKLQPTRQNIMLLDGRVDMIAAFEMEVEEVRSLDEGRSEAASPNPMSRLWKFFRRPKNGPAEAGQ
ncbi:DUF3299 domain-containing protein [Rhodobacterales bacterium]|nr:DUF3299 domain-containing protein [Rhodobacterales bacterium]